MASSVRPSVFSNGPLLGSLNFRNFSEKLQLQKTLTRLHMYIETWSENTLLVQKCYLIKTA